MILETIHSPADVKALDEAKLPQLCQELREFLVESVSLLGRTVHFLVVSELLHTCMTLIPGVKTVSLKQQSRHT